MRQALAQLLAPELAELTSYVPHPGQYAVRLDANESPPVDSERMRADLVSMLADATFERYPDAEARDLRAAIAAHMGATPEEILVGVGSDEIVAMLLTALRQPKAKNGPATILATTPSFVMYRINARARGMRVLEVPLDDAWDLATDSMLRAVDMAPANVIFVASPNNPTGTLASHDRLEKLIVAAPDSVVVVDEAYVDFSECDAVDLYRQYDNVVVMRTLSKVGFAGLRVGWLLARPDLIRELDKVRQPFNLSGPSQLLATRVLTEHWNDVQASVRSIRAERSRLQQAINELPECSAAESHANFLWLKTPGNAGELFEALKSQGVLVRSFHTRGGRLARHLRVTVSTRADNDAFLQALTAVLNP